MARVNLTAWRQYFAKVAKMCSERVRGYPKGQRRQAFLACMREYLRSAKV